MNPSNDAVHELANLSTDICRCRVIRNFISDHAPIPPQCASKVFQANTGVRYPSTMFPGKRAVRIRLNPLNIVSPRIYPGTPNTDVITNKSLLSKSWRVMVGSKREDVRIARKRCRALNESNVIDRRVTEPRSLTTI